MFDRNGTKKYDLTTKGLIFIGIEKSIYIPNTQYHAKQRLRFVETL
jgi:hypothetical protein